jgi:putative Holliday junction resolvase
VRCLALDVGDRRTGVAVGEWLARPVTTLKRRSKKQDFEAIAALLQEHQAERLVVGLPLNMDGSPGFQAQRVMRYTERLESALGEMGLEIDVVLWDERLSTYEAQERIGQVSGHGAGPDVDAAAAAVILQSYLDANVKGQGD